MTAAPRTICASVVPRRPNRERPAGDATGWRPEVAPKKKVGVARQTGQQRPDDEGAEGKRRRDADAADEKKPGDRPHQVMSRVSRPIWRRDDDPEFGDEAMMGSRAMEPKGGISRPRLPGRRPGGVPRARRENRDAGRRGKARPPWDKGKPEVFADRAGTRRQRRGGGEGATRQDGEGGARAT